MRSELSVDTDAVFAYWMQPYSLANQLFCCSNWRSLHCFDAAMWVAGRTSGL